MKKYTNRKTITQGLKFDSQLEARRYIYLKNWERLGLIKDLRVQTPFQLSTEKNMSPIWMGRKYIADFCYTRHGLHVIEDAKCSYTARNEIFRAKKKRMQELGMHVREILPRYVPFLDLPPGIAYKQKILSSAIRRKLCRLK